MPRTIDLAVSKCTESTNGGYVLTLVHKSKGDLVQTPFGKTTKTGISTYYMKVDSPVDVGFQSAISLADYDIVERAFTTESGAEIELKWLHIK